MSKLEPTKALQILGEKRSAEASRKVLNFPTLGESELLVESDCEFLKRVNVHPNALSLKGKVYLK